MPYIIACYDPELLVTLCAFADHLATLPDPRDPRGVRHALPVLLATLLVALGEATPSRAAGPAAGPGDGREGGLRRYRPGGLSHPRRRTVARPSSATVTAVSGAPAPSWAVPASASGWRTPKPGPVCAA